MKTKLMACVLSVAAVSVATAQQKVPIVGKLKGYHTIKPVNAADGDAIKKDIATSGTSSKTSLPLFTFNVTSSRDGNTYQGVMVGRDPFHHGGTAHVKTFIVPIVVTTNTVFTPSGVGPGTNTYDPTAPDNTCMASPNNVPLTVFRQSPIFDKADFNYGGTDVGRTQAVDAFQRANFWKVEDKDEFHTLLGPIETVDPIVLNVPDAFGITVPTDFFLTPPCGPLGIIDINWFDNLINTTILPSMPQVNSGNLPIFLLYNVVMASPVQDLGTCCILGYHGTTNNAPIGTYSPIDFNTNGVFGTGISDTSIATHEVGEWMNDPFGVNPVPAFGNVGQVQGFCQNNLEVGDPLTGTNAPPIVMSNGFTYHLQELAFFSWFFGAPSIGIHGWFSDNDTFTTDAGPVCH